MRQGGFLHEALYYAGLDEFLAGTTSFVRSGLDAGEPVLVAVPEPRLAALRDEHRNDPVTFVDMAEVGRNPNRILPWVLQTFINQHEPKPVRIIGEPIFAGRTADEIDLAIQHEALVNVAFADANAVIQCPYDARTLPHLVADAEQTHPIIVTRTGRRPSDGYANPYHVVAARNRPLPERMVVDEILVFDARRLSRVRATVAEHARESGLGDDRIDDLKIAVSEVCSNAITHGGPGLATLRMWSDDDRVVYEVRGAGHITDVMAGRTVPPDGVARGRGLLIANQLCDLIQSYTAPAGTVTRMHMLLSPS